MIELGALCLIVGDPKISVNGGNVLPTRICTVHRIPSLYAATRRAVCDIELATGEICFVSHWQSLRPLTPPPDESQTLRDRELENA